jgi:hypothetical protein
MPMPLQHWAELVTREVRARLPDVRAMRRGTTVVWKLGQHSATLNAADPRNRWLRIDTGGRGHPLTHDEDRNATSARVTAANIVVHFEPRWCRGLDVEPYPHGVIHA